MARQVLEVGQTVLNGRYKVLSVIASKGMSAVYKVEDSSLHKKWCLKEIKKSNAGRGNVEYEALIQEANIMKTLDHVGIPRITTIEEEGDSLFIIMDYVDGMSMKSWLTQKGKINQDVVLLWMRQIVQTMMYLHNRKNPIFYRDMKPDNIMIQTDGNLKLLDFGISMVLTGKDDVILKALGTKGYAAPEQSKRGLKCDLRSDIYAMGKTMYFMLTGINPSQVKDGAFKRVRDVDPTIDEEVQAIVEKCCQENPNKRYQCCEDLLYDIQNCKAINRSKKRSMRKKIAVTFSMIPISIPMFYGCMKLNEIGMKEMSMVCLGMGILALVLFILFFIIFHIPRLINELSGRKKKSQVEKLKQLGTGGLGKINMASDSEILAEGFTRVETPVSVKKESENIKQKVDVSTDRVDKKVRRHVDNVENSVDISKNGTDFVSTGDISIKTRDTSGDVGVFMSSKRSVSIISEQKSV